jgi:hypothetical protein
MRINSVVCASALILSSLLAACGQRDQSGQPPPGAGTGGGAAGTATGGAPATPATPPTPPASAASN